MKIDNTDKKILNILQQDGRRRLMEEDRISRAPPTSPVEKMKLSRRSQMATRQMLNMKDFEAAFASTPSPQDQTQGSSTIADDNVITSHKITI